MSFFIMRALIVLAKASATNKKLGIFPKCSYFFACVFYNFDKDDYM